MTMRMTAVPSSSASPTPGTRLSGRGSGESETPESREGSGGSTPSSEPDASPHVPGRIDASTVYDWTALALPASPQAAGSFRRHALSAIRRWGLHSETGDTIEACVSELVTNAIVHGVGRDVLMLLYFTGDSVLTEVFGQALDEPAIPTTARSDDAESGRGLLIVETLAKDWGSEHTGHGLLRVWASIAAFGNNLALIVGPAMADWQDVDMDEVACRTTIDGRIVGEAVAGQLPGGPLQAIAFALNQAAELGIALPAGTLLSTGAITGVHPIDQGQRAEADFGRWGTLRCQSTAARP